MQPDFDVVVVGSGPAGVSVSFPLAEAGIRTLMVDGGLEATIPALTDPFLTERANSHEQWKWIIGEDFHALRNIEAISPKFRVPAHGYVFQDFLTRNQIVSKDVVAIGSLSSGGLSNAWGCGVARLSKSELSYFPFPLEEIYSSYGRVARRIGISGRSTDDLSDYFGVDEWADPALLLDAVNDSIFRRYATGSSLTPGFRLGRARLAVLARNTEDRRACNLSGNCLWGCSRKALYSSADEVSVLSRNISFYYRSGFLVDNIRANNGLILLEGTGPDGYWSVAAKRIVLAAGTLATTRIAMRAIGYGGSLRLQCSPAAAFLLWVPGMTGHEHSHGFGLGQLSFVLKLADDVTAFGSTFSPTGIPVTEFVRHLPLSARYGIDVLRHLLSSCLAGNLFFPGNISQISLRLTVNGTLLIEGNHGQYVLNLMSNASRLLRCAFWRLGAILMPMSFSVAKPGSDTHYGCTLPMRENPKLGETDRWGELKGFDNVHIVDGASLSSLSEKSHTLTIMANADRIGRELAIRANNEKSVFNRTT
ncbi:FAD-dependent monooxygenase [Candidatus Thiosymbion oneisti]|uniref:FAD-dependent monooxygenase n=1 Tax=Candidatus Thiosymbion oneisti TaxID=589554 RepID=UPI000A4103E5|nr:FAD-dependent monooxygenase [Candidatus Thiosymbion oneisti]